LKNPNARPFNKDLSVFRDWHEDGPHNIPKALEHDQKWWKVKMLTKTKPEELDRECMEIVR
jgi:hypothetical protein